MTRIITIYKPQWPPPPGCGFRGCKTTSLIIKSWVSYCRPIHYNPTCRLWRAKHKIPRTRRNAIRWGTRFPCRRPRCSCRICCTPFRPDAQSTRYASDTSSWAAEFLRAGTLKVHVILLLLLSSSSFLWNPSERTQRYTLLTVGTHGVRIFHRSPRWTAGRICWFSCSAGRTLTRQDTISSWPRRLCTRRTCRIAPGPRTGRSSWGIGIVHLLVKSKKIKSTGHEK